MGIGKATAALGLAAAMAVSGCSSFHAGPMPGAPPKAKFVDAGGARVHVVDEGEGPPVVLLHGFASSVGTWKDVIPRLAREHRVIALDLKGFGWTSRPPGDYSPAAQAKLVLAVLDAKGVEEPVDLVAHSWGSSIALELALRAPKRVSKIALYDAWVYEDQLPTTFLMARAPGVGEAIVDAFYFERSDDKLAIAFHDPRKITEELAENVEDQLSRPGTRAAALAAIRGQRFGEVEDRYRTIDKPVLLLWGREDRVTTLEVGERLSKDLPNAKLVVYPQCGHFPMIEAASPSTRDLVEFLRPAAAPAPATIEAPAAPKPDVEPAPAPAAPRPAAPTDDAPKPTEPEAPSP
jgi:pimeloyl-ACP methyl ester carboxylesterase